MKNINQIFNTNKQLLDEVEVKELIEYCQELEGQVMDAKISKQFSFEDKLSGVVRDIYTSCVDMVEQDDNYDRWPHDYVKPNYSDTIRNLKMYILKFSSDNNFRL